MPLNRQLPRVDVSRFSMVPRADIPRSTFATTHSVKSTFPASYLIPIHVDEVLPGDVHQGNMTIFARLATPLFPIMDNIELESFFFFCPCRLVWTNFVKMMGERASPADSISYTFPQVVSSAGGFGVNTIYDYFGLPTTGQVTGGQTVSVNCLPFRAYQLIYNEWFRDQNLTGSISISLGDGPDSEGAFSLKKRNKKHDYFTSALPWPLKGGVEVSMPLSGNAPIHGLAVADAVTPTAGNPSAYSMTQPLGAPSGWAAYFKGDVANTLAIRSVTTGIGSDPMIYADLTQATGATINALRLAFQTQRLLERDARSGTRYTELIQAHYGVSPEDTRLQRPEYIGGGRTNVNTQAIPQTSATTISGSNTAIGSLAGTATFSDSHRFSVHAKEHGYIIGLVQVRADITYQQGLHRMWTRLTRYDIYWPVFQALGEQIIRNDEIYCTGTDATDVAAFGYQERWAEYRHRPSRITGMFKSTSATNVDEWHVSEQFLSAPALNDTFIQDNTNTTLIRVLAAGAAANNMQVLFDSVFDIKTTRAMPMFSVPGMVDHF